MLWPGNWSVKAASPHKISLKSALLVAELWPKTIYNIAAVRHLEFKKIIFGHVTVIEFQMCRHKIAPKSDSEIGNRPIDAVNVLCAQLTRDLFAIAKFLLFVTIDCICKS